MPESFTYTEIQSDVYKLAAWEKITDKNTPIRIYIEGDGHAFNKYGRPTDNPTPHGDFVRKMAMNDPNANVVYLARPCQYVSDDMCSRVDWTTGRFSQKIVDSTYSAIKQISNNRPVILIGYSGGALLSGLVIQTHPELNAKKWITIAGVLNHTKWTNDLGVPPLTKSLDLERVPHINQIHFVGAADDTVSYKTAQSMVSPEHLIIIPSATHTTGYTDYMKMIYEN